MKAKTTERKLLWQAAIKWPLYSLAVMPTILAASWNLWIGENIRISQLIGFLLSSIFLLLWENLSNDLFDSETGVDQFKFHSMVNLLGNKRVVRNLACISLLIGLGLNIFLALKSNIQVFYLVLGCCCLGYLYQGPPFRLGYKGLGEPLCWIAFGPLATASALIVISPNTTYGKFIPWQTATLIGAGPALATTLVLFCSHFHQVAEDAQNGKISPLVRLGTKRSADLIPWIISLILFVELIPIFNGEWPVTTLLGLVAIKPGLRLIDLLKKHHNYPEKIKESKFLALKFHTLNSIGLSIGFTIGSLLYIN